MTLTAISMAPLFNANLDFENADNRWNTELKNVYGRHAVDARYDGRGRGQEGTSLRAAYEARTEAYEIWNTLRDEYRAA